MFFIGSEALLDWILLHPVTKEYLWHSSLVSPAERKTQRSVTRNEHHCDLIELLNMSGRGVSTPEGSAKKAPESAQHKRKSTEGDSGARERGERGGRKRSKAVGEEVKIVETTVTAIAATTAARREPDRRIYQCSDAWILVCVLVRLAECVWTVGLLRADSISEGVPFQPCEQPYEVEDSGVGLGFNFWMTHREVRAACGYWCCRAAP